MKLVMLDGKLYEVHPKKGGKILLTPTKFSLRTEVEGVMVSAREVTRNEGVVQDRRRAHRQDEVPEIEIEVPKGTLSDRVAESFPEGVGEPGTDGGQRGVGPHDLSDEIRWHGEVFYSSIVATSDDRDSL